MVEPVTLWPVRSVSKSMPEEGARLARTQSASSRPHPTENSLPKLVSLAADLAKADAPIDHAKVAQIQQAIAHGEYAIDVNATAHAMTAFFRTGD